MVEDSYRRRAELDPQGRQLWGGQAICRWEGQHKQRPKGVSVGVAKQTAGGPPL